MLFRSPLRLTPSFQSENVHILLPMPSSEHEASTSIVPRPLLPLTGTHNMALTPTSTTHDLPEPEQKNNQCVFPTDTQQSLMKPGDFSFAPPPCRNKHTSPSIGANGNVLHALLKVLHSCFMQHLTAGRARQGSPHRT